MENKDLLLFIVRILRSVTSSLERGICNIQPPEGGFLRSIVGDLLVNANSSLSRWNYLLYEEQRSPATHYITYDGEPHMEMSILPYAYCRSFICIERDSALARFIQWNKVSLCYVRGLFKGLFRRLVSFIQRNKTRLFRSLVQFIQLNKVSILASHLEDIFNRLKSSIQRNRIGLFRIRTQFIQWNRRVYA